jgi:hypothetical protein
MDVLIKEVEGQKIWLRESEITSFKEWDLYIPMTFIAIGGILASSSMSNDWERISDATRFNFGIIVAILSIPVMFICFINPMGWFIKSAYVVHTSGEDNIVIFKTTPEADQKLICKAAQELEGKIKETVKEKRVLETIAGRCK